MKTFSREWTCECCLATIHTSLRDPWPKGWSECGMSKKVKGREGKAAMWCPRCQTHIETGEHTMQAEISGTVEFKMPTPPPLPPAPPIKPTIKETVLAVSAAMKSLLASGINQDAVIALLYDRMRPIRCMRGTRKMSKREIAYVIRSLGELEKAYCR